MLLRHLEALRPICPACRAPGDEGATLTLSAVLRRDGDDVREGILACTSLACQREHPVVDGIPIVLPDLRSWAPFQLDAVLRRSDLSAEMASLLGDAAGPDSIYDRDRATISTYAASHWFDCHTEGGQETVRPAEGLAQAALGFAGESPVGPWIDLGCGPGRATFETARARATLTVGADLNFGLLAVGESIRSTGWARYARRRVGLVYDERSIRAPGFREADVSFWCCDAMALPFPSASFGGALSLNVLDAVTSPRGHLGELSRALAPGGVAVLTSPYDWSGLATPVEQWVGGHSQRRPTAGSSNAEVRALLGEPPVGPGLGLAVEAEQDGVPWFLSTNERVHVEYRLDMLRLRRLA